QSQDRAGLAGSLRAGDALDDGALQIRKSPAPHDPAEGSREGVDPVERRPRREDQGEGSGPQKRQGRREKGAAKETLICRSARPSRRFGGSFCCRNPARRKQKPQASIICQNIISYHIIFLLI